MKTINKFDTKTRCKNLVILTNGRFVVYSTETELFTVDPEFKTMEPIYSKGTIYSMIALNDREIAIGRN